MARGDEVENFTFEALDNFAEDDRGLPRCNAMIDEKKLEERLPKGLRWIHGERWTVYLGQLAAHLSAKAQM